MAIFKSFCSLAWNKILNELDTNLSFGQCQFLFMKRVFFFVIDGNEEFKWSVFAEQTQNTTVICWSLCLFFSQILNPSLALLVRTRWCSPIKLFKCAHIFLSFAIIWYNLLSDNWLKCHVMYLWLIWQEGGGVFLVSLMSVLLFRMAWLASLMLNTSEPESETRGTSVLALILKVRRNSWHLAI